MAVTTEDITIPAADGLALAATVYRTDGDEWCSMASAVGVRRRFYRRFATALAEEGVNVVTFDYRGIGDSPARGEDTGPPTMSKWAEQDLEGVLAWIHAQRPSRQFHVGHSGGGQFLGLCPSNVHVESAVAVASQWGHWELWPKHRHRRMWTLWHVIIPVSTRLRGHFPAKLFNMGEPLPRGVALEWARWCRRKDFLLEGRPERQARFDAFHGRIQAISLTDDDDFAPHDAAAELLAHYRHADTDHVDLAPEDLGLDAIGHFGYFTRRCAGDWPALLAWLRGSDDATRNDKAGPPGSQA